MKNDDLKTRMMNGERRTENRRLVFSFSVLGSPFIIFFAFLLAQAAAQPSAAKVQIVLRYAISSPRDQHVLQYDALIAHLHKVDFQFDPPLEKHADTDREDRSKNYLRGSIAADKFLKVLDNPNVASIMIMPEDFEYPPKDLDKLVRVRLELAGNLGTQRQRELADQVKAVLTAFQFREAVGYDHRGYSGRPFTRLTGTIPQGRLEVLLKDLRGQPAGWFASRIPPDNVPPPLRNVNPIRVVEVLADSEPIADIAAAQPRVPEYLEKISPDLWALINEAGADNEPVRIEIIFAGTLNDSAWRSALAERAPGLFVEGQLGQVVNATVTRGQVKGLAALDSISTIRLPRLARVDIDPALNLPGDNDKALALTGLDTLHKKGFLGKGVRLAIIDHNFRGWAQLVQKGKLPAATRLVDLTPERAPDLYPAPFPSNPGQLGHGSQCALAAALAAPQAELVLVRVGSASPYQLEEIVRTMRGGNLSSPYLDRRRDELVTARAELNLLRSQVLFERKIILEDFTDETDLEKDFGFLGPVYGWVFSQRTWSRARVAYADKLEQELNERNSRFFKLVEGLRSLDGIRLVACPLVWNDGFAVGAASPLSRALENLLSAGPTPNSKNAKTPFIWLQAAGNTRGQAWSGLYRDDDNNGIMEFAPADYALKNGQWTSELNFLAWQPYGKAEVADLLEGTRLKISLQWREPHDPDYFTPSEGQDFYRKPLANLKLALLRQRDASGKTTDIDSLDLVAVSSGIPQRLEHKPGGSIYEVVLETTLEKSGRYAVRVERPVGYQWLLTEETGQKRPMFARLDGLIPSGLRPLGVVTLPALEKKWELQPRLFVDAEGAERLKGRPIFADFATDQGSVAVPADARSVISVGAADWENKPRPYSAGGPLPFAELSKKPSLLTYDALNFGPENTGGAFGTSLATSFAAGTVACMLSAGMTPEMALNYLNKQNGGVLKVPAK